MLLALRVEHELKPCVQSTLPSGDDILWFPRSPGPTVASLCSTAFVLIKARDAPEVPSAAFRLLATMPRLALALLPKGDGRKTTRYITPTRPSANSMALLLLGLLQIPKAEGFERRQRLYKLYHYLNQLNLFGDPKVRETVETLTDQILTA